MTPYEFERLSQLCELDDDGVELTSSEYEELRNLINRENDHFISTQR